MPGYVIIGTQWGDEGKGKITDFYAETMDYIVRFQGGNNAGHTIIVGRRKFKLHLIPSGIIRPGKTCVIGNGVIVDLGVLVSEMETLKKMGVSVDGLRISDRANIIMPYHIKLDGAEEKLRGKKSIGTTRRGIGPTYADRAARLGIRIADLYDDGLREKLKFMLSLKSEILEKVYGIEVGNNLNHNAVYEELVKYGEYIRPHVTDTARLLNEALRSGKNVLFEGAQGTMLDVEHGTYPYTTSSHTVAGSVCIGAGVAPKHIAEVMGVVKAYTTRVGGGPMPTELVGKTGNYIRERGGEFGTTTGRPRRCGWLDLAVVKYACMLSGVDKIALTKLDVLSGIKKLKVCTHYVLSGSVVESPPPTAALYKRCQPAYEELPGWEKISPKGWEKICEKGYDSLPKEAKNYVEFIEEFCGLPVTIISVGPERKMTLTK